MTYHSTDPLHTELLALRHEVRGLRAQVDASPHDPAAALLEAMFDGAPVGLGVHDRELRFVRINRALTLMNGVPADDCLGRTLDEVVPGIAPAIEPVLRQVLDSGEPVVDLAIDAVTPAGTGNWLASFFPVRASGQVVAVGVLIQDVTEQARLREQLIHSQKMETVGRLAGGVAHDFNNLLTVILSHAELVIETPKLDDGLREDVEQIRLAAQRAAALTRQLLSFARRQVLQPRVVDLNALTRGIERMIRRLLGDNVRLVLDLAPELWPVRVDPSQIELVLVNLVVNARDAMPVGGVLTVRSANTTLGDGAAALPAAELEPGDYVRISVSDTGHGMSPEVMAHVFEPFFTTKPPGQGTGLGLATCHGIMRQTGGGIAVNSAPGKGTTVSLYFARSGVD